MYRITSGAPARALVMTLTAGVTIGGLATVADAAPANHPTSTHTTAKHVVKKSTATKSTAKKKHATKKKAHHAKKKAAVRPAVPKAMVASLRSLRGCESGGNYATNTGNGYYGAYQFSLGTWRGLGYGGSPASSPSWQQDQAVVRLHAARGWSPWPSCSRALGLV